MPSSISSSDPRIWRRFFRLLLGSTLGVLAFVWLFTVIVDPWGMLPLSPRLPRVPISTNARFSFPALAVSQDFDSVIVGDSTSRLLRPATLDPLFSARFANLAMNAATAYEQMRMLDLFARHHRTPRAVIVGMDASWCLTGPAYQKFTPRPFPAWMYGDNRWRGYLHMLSLYAVQEAVNQFQVMIGVKPRRYGLDGYTVFTPPDDQYDPARARKHFAAEGAPDTLGPPQGDPASLNFPTMPLLHATLTRLPAETQKIVFFSPYLLQKQGAPGSRAHALWAECKRRVVNVARGFANATVVDFLVPSAITRNPMNYWDPVHYRVGVAERLAHDLSDAAHHATVPAEDGAVLWPEPSGAEQASVP
jgi:hypothetical protein